MKRFTVLLFSVIWALTSANAQFKVGVKAGYDLKEFTSLYEILDRPNRKGFYFGGTAIYMTHSKSLTHFGGDISVIYEERDATLEGDVPVFDENDNITGKESVSTTVKSKRIAIPLNLRYQLFRLDALGCLFVYGGPQIDFNVGNRQVKEWTLRSSNFSTNVGAGFMIFGHFQVNVNYNVAVGKTGEQNLVSLINSTTHIKDDAVNVALNAAGLKNSNTRAHSWQMGLTFYF